jgi:response regulator of citrate/malate metabolism
MNITLIEPDIILSEKISSKLKIKGAVLKHITSLSQNSAIVDSDIILLSTSFTQKSVLDFLGKYTHKNIILLVNDFYNEDIQKFLDKGVDEYILKPFRIKHLMKKVNLFTLQKKLDIYESYYKYASDSIFVKLKGINNIKPSTVYVTNQICLIDKAILEYGLKLNQPYVFISCNSSTWEEELHACKKDDAIYLSNIQELSRYRLVELSNRLRDRNFILSSTKHVKIAYPVVKLDNDNIFYDGSYIIGHEEYIKFVIEKFQDKMTTTALSEKLQISRKTVYEKRKKYNLHKNTDKRLVS